MATPPLSLHELTSDTGLRARFTNLGATLMGLWVPDRAGSSTNVVLGLSKPEDYQGNHPFLGATVGRFANRIARGRFQIGTRTFQLPCNDGPNHLHGGPDGFHTRRWQARELRVDGHPAVAFSHSSPDGHAGCGNQSPAGRSPGVRARRRDPDTGHR